MPYSASSAGSGRRPVLVQIDAVVDHADPIERNTVELVHVALHRRRDRHDAVGVLVGGPLDPRRDVIRRAQLLDLPRPVRLERMRRQDERRALQILRHAARPGACTTCGSARCRCPTSLPLMIRSRSIVSNSFAWRGSCAWNRGGGWNALDAKGRGLLGLIAEAQHVDVVPPVVQARQLACEVFDVDAGAAVHVRRILVGEDRDPHRCPCGCQLPTSKLPTPKVLRFVTRPGGSRCDFSPQTCLGVGSWHFWELATVSHLGASAAFTRSGVNGALRSLTPVASKKALPSAAATGTVPASPAPRSG